MTSSMFMETSNLNTCNSYVVCKKTMLDIILMYLLKGPSFFILCTIYEFKEIVPCIHII